MPETAKRLIAHLQLTPADQLLDICTGTGVVVLAAAEQLSQGKVTGIDLSSGMLTQARSKAAAKSLSNTEFRQMGLENLEFDEATFDIATGSFAGEASMPMADILIKHYEATGRVIPPLSWKHYTFGLAIKQLFKSFPTI